MPGHPLIDGYLTALALRLPADAVDELADGLTETYEHHLALTRDPDAAARAAVAEFGRPAEVTAAFTRNSPGHRGARLLLATGPVAGALWALTLVTGHAWAWPVPLPACMVFAAFLLAVVAALVTSATGRAHYARTRVAAMAGSVGLLILDAAALTGLALITPTLAWTLLAAALASLTRMGMTLRVLPRIFAR